MAHKLLLNTETDLIITNSKNYDIVHHYPTATDLDLSYISTRLTNISNGYQSAGHIETKLTPATGGPVVIDGIATTANMKDAGQLGFYMANGDRWVRFQNLRLIAEDIEAVTEDRVFAPNDSQFYAEDISSTSYATWTIDLTLSGHTGLGRSLFTVRGRDRATGQQVVILEGLAPANVNGLLKIQITGTCVAV